jgi:hypothetical protein
MACALIVAPIFAYPVFLMKAPCFALLIREDDLRAPARPYYKSSTTP